MTRVHPEESQDQIDLLEKIQCEKCDLWVLKLGMRNHLRIHLEDPCQCDFCGKEYSNKIKLKNHIYKKHRDKEGTIRKYNTETILKIECHTCQKMIRKCNIEKHISICQIKCDPCGGIEFSNKLKYICHQKEVHLLDPVKVKCEICGKSYSRASIKQHIKSVHEKIKDFQCLECGKAFSEKATLKAHETFHTGIRNFKCDQCEKTYKRDHHLKNHISEVHEGRKDHICSDCGKAFGNSKNLRRHSDIIHKGIKRWKCDYCSNAYGQSHELKKHLQICHNKA